MSKNLQFSVFGNNFSGDMETHIHTDDSFKEAVIVAYKYVKANTYDQISLRVYDSKGIFMRNFANRSIEFFYEIREYLL